MKSMKSFLIYAGEVQERESRTAKNGKKQEFIRPNKEVVLFKGR